MWQEKTIIVTTERTFSGEHELWQQLLELGIGKIHVRKPGLSKENLVELLTRVPEGLRKRLVLHHYLDIALKTGTGVHLPFHKLSGNKPIIPHNITLSASVHSWEEAKTAMKFCNYCLISPVFDSITKTGYTANPELGRIPDDLRGQKIYALGGMSDRNIRQALASGYYGCAFLGFIWQDREKAVENATAVLQGFLSATGHE